MAITPGSIKCDGNNKVSMEDIINAIHALENRTNDIEALVVDKIPWKSATSVVAGKNVLNITIDGSTPSGTNLAPTP